LIERGFGKPLEGIPLEDQASISFLLLIASTLVILASLWSKTSFALTLLRFPIGWLLGFVWFIIVSVHLIIGLSAFGLWILCLDPNARASPFTGLACLPRNVGISYNVFSGIYSAVMDVTLAIIPWKFLFGLQMKRSEKTGVAVAMSMGVLWVPVYRNGVPQYKLTAAAVLPSQQASKQATTLMYLTSLTLVSPPLLGPEVGHDRANTKFQGYCPLVHRSLSGVPLRRLCPSWQPRYPSCAFSSRVKAPSE